MKKPKIETVYGGDDSPSLFLVDGMHLDVDEIKENYEGMIDALIKMQKLWWNEVYEFGYGEFEGDFERAKELADDDSHNKLMIEALLEAGCYE